MRLTRVFMLTTGVLLTLVSIMLARAVLQEWRTVNAAENGLHAMALTQLAMKIAEKASYERGPTNVVLGDGADGTNGAAPDAAKRRRMMEARKASDDAIDALTATLAGSPYADHRTALAQLAKTREALVRARAETERVAALPFAARSGDARNVVWGPVRQMFGVIDIALETVTILSADAERTYPELSTQLVGARQAAELREYAGRLGSQLTGALGARLPLNPDELRDIPLLEGRIEQLRQLIEVSARVKVNDPRVSQAIAEMKKHYFEIGQPLVNSLIATGAGGSDYAMDLKTFVDRYQPEMGYIVVLRDTLFDAARSGGNRQYARARREMSINAAIGIAVLLVEITVFLLIRWRVLRPLLANTRSVVDIASGKLDIPLPDSGRADEIGDMQRAIAVLRQTSIDKQQLEVEREQLIEKLKRHSNIDFLTNLLNRRSFTERVTQQLAIARRNNWPVALIMFDLDHFKLVNDCYGHSVGDQVLAGVAATAQTVFRATDTLARHGGEEFIAMLVNCNEADAVAFAERLRLAISAVPFSAEDATVFKVTASFGVASAAASDVNDLNAFIQRADVALYRAKGEGRNRVVAGATA